MGSYRALPISFFVGTEFFLNDWHVKLILFHAQELDVDLIPCFPPESEQNPSLGITRLGIDIVLELGQRPEMQSLRPVVLLDSGFLGAREGTALCVMEKEPRV